MTELHHAYALGPISVLVVDKIDEVWIIAIQKLARGAICQFPFVPVHKIVLDNFVNMAADVGEYMPNSIADAIDVWESGGKGFFTVSIDEIWQIGIECLERNGDPPSEFKVEGGFLFPPIYPVGVKDIKEGQKHNYFALDHTVGCSTYDARNN